MRQRQVCQEFFRESGAVNGSNAQTCLLQSCFEAWCARRPMLTKEWEGQGCSRILHPKRHKGLTLTLFLCSVALPLPLLRQLWLFTHTPFFNLRQFTSSCFLLFYIRSYLQTFPTFAETVTVSRLDQGYPPGVCQQAAVTGFFFSTASPSKMSCPVRKIVKPSQSWAECGVWRLE